MKQRFLIILTVIVLLPIKLAAADTLTVEQKLVSGIQSYDRIPQPSVAERSHSL